MIQSLVDEYRPETATENLLIQQIGMAWLRLHRLWGVEAAIANESMLKTEKAIRFPHHLESAGNVLEKMGKSKSQKVELETLERDINQAIIAGSALSDTEKLAQLSRYERHITKGLHDALDRLALIRLQRQEKV